MIRHHRVAKIYGLDEVWRIWDNCDEQHQLPCSVFSSIFISHNLYGHPETSLDQGPGQELDFLKLDCLSKIWKNSWWKLLRMIDSPTVGPIQHICCYEIRIVCIRPALVEDEVQPPTTPHSYSLILGNELQIFFKDLFSIIYILIMAFRYKMSFDRLFQVSKISWQVLILEIFCQVVSVKENTRTRS